MVLDANRIRKEIPGNTFIKIPAGPDAFSAIKILKEDHFKVSCTAVMTLNQALLAAAAGADIIAIYVSRLNKAGIDSEKLLKDIQTAYTNLNISTIICAASIKDTVTVEHLAIDGIHYMAIDEQVLDQCAHTYQV